MSVKILLADNDSVLRKLLCTLWTKEKYEVILAKDGEEAIDLFFQQKDVALCVVDMMLPVYNGYEVLASIREHSEVPVIITSSLLDDACQLKALKNGADDYLTKPFSYEILLARAENLLKKHLKQREATVEVGDFVLDQKGHALYVQGEDVSLNPKEFALFSLFLTHLGQVFSREQLLSNVWGYGYEGEIRTVDTHIKMLRKKLGGYGRHVVTVRGTGYKLQA